MFLRRLASSSEALRLPSEHAGLKDAQELAAAHDARRATHPRSDQPRPSLYPLYCAKAPKPLTDTEYPFGNPHPGVPPIRWVVLPCDAKAA